VDERPLEEEVENSQPVDARRALLNEVSVLLA